MRRGKGVNIFQGVDCVGGEGVNMTGVVIVETVAAARRANQIDMIKAIVA